MSDPSPITQELLELDGSVPRLTPSVANALRSAVDPERAAHVCGLLVGASNGDEEEAVADQLELLPCQQGAGHPLSFEELAALQDKANAVRALPRRRIIGLVRTFSQDPLVFSTNENSNIREAVSGCAWLFAVKAFPGGEVRARVFRLQADGWSLAADFGIGVAISAEPAKARPSTAARVFSVAGALPPAAAALIAALTIAMVAWACIRLRPAASAPDPGFRVGNDGDLLGLSWDREVPAVQASTGALLRIEDGGAAREVHLDPAQVANGLVLYRPSSGDVAFRLDIRGKHGEALRASVRWIDPAHTAARSAYTLGMLSEPASAKQLVEASHPHRPGSSPASKRVPHAGGDGLARFVVKTPGVRLRVRSLDEPHAGERAVVAGSVRLPEGHWIVYATAPGYEPSTVRFLVNRAGPADVLIRLRERQRAGRRLSAGT